MGNDLERIYREHRQGLFTLALSLTGCPAKAEDAVHEAFTRLFRQNIQPTGDPAAYVFAAVRNAAIDQVRRQHPMQLPSPDGDDAWDALLGPDRTSLFAAAPSNPLRDAIVSEQQQLVARAIDRLPAAQREAVVLHLIAGLTFEQMAQTLHEPLPTVASRYRRALQQLRELLSGVT